MLRVYIPGDAAVYRNYARAVRRAGAVPCFTDDPADCGCLLLPGGGDLSPIKTHAYCPRRSGRGRNRIHGRQHRSAGNA